MFDLVQVSRGNKTFQGFYSELQDYYKSIIGGTDVTNPAEGSQNQSDWLITDNDQPMGIVSLKFISNSTVELKNLYIAPVARKRGLARRTVVKIEEYLSSLNVTRLVLETTTYQPEAINLYVSLGYSKDEGRWSSYYGDPIAVFFKRDLG